MIKLTDILSEILSEKKLCPKGRAYYNRRISAGEKPSAYLSGRAVKVCKGLMKEFLNEEIDPSEAYNDTDAIDTLVKRKRDLAFIVQGANTDNNWAKIQKTIKDNDIRIMYVKGNPHHAYIAYLPGSENKATKLKDLAEKYDGYLSAQATKEDTIQIGRLLGYKEDKIKEYVNKNYPNDPMDESLRDWFQKENLNELRQGLLNYLKQQLPNTPDYVIQDWIYKMIKTSDDVNTVEGIQDWLNDWVKDLKWETKTNFPITMDIFGDKTQKELKSRIGGEIRQDVGKDIERHKTQQNLLKSQGISKEPIIIFKTKNGKYELGEGWHRTTQAFKMYPEGFIQPNVYIGLNAKWLSESLRDWFQKEDWVRIDTQGNITGPCGTMKQGKATTRCLPRAKANNLTKAERAATARKKVAGSKKGKQFVSNTKKAKVKLRK